MRGMIKEQEMIIEHNGIDKVKEVYFDNSATTRPYDEVIEYMNYINYFGI